MDGTKKNPPENSLAGDFSEGSQDIEKFPSRLERYNKAKKRSTLMEKYCRSIGADKEAGKLRDCGNWLSFHHYYTVNKIRLARAHFCKKTLLCPLCAIRRGAKSLKAYLDRYKVIKSENDGLQGSIVTLTVKNSENLEECFEHLRNGIKKLNQRRKDSLRNRASSSEWSKVLGLVGSYEVTNQGKGWHPHSHMIVLHKEKIDQWKLSEEWEKITGDSFIVDVSPFRNPDNLAKDFIEVFKYSLKFSDLSFKNNFTAYKTFTGKRLLFSSGLFRGVQVPKEMTDELLDDLPYVELFYRYFPKSGYNFMEKESFIGPKNSTKFDLVLPHIPRKKPPS